MTTAVVPVAGGHPAFDQVAALFDDYRVHYGQPPAPELARSWLRDQVTRGRLVVAAAGARRVSLQTEADNIPALTLYTGAGFRPVTGLELLNLSLDPTQH